MKNFLNVLALMVGARVVSPKMLELYKDGDFIPDGESIASKELIGKFRPTTPFDVYQCCHWVGSDIQSGPYYCGRIATQVVGTRDKHIGLCKKHAHRCGSNLRWATPKAKDSLLALP